jgi:hypothetical protein
MVLVVRDVRGPWPDHVQRDTTSDGTLARGHSRSEFTFTKLLSRSSSWPRTPGFQPGDAGSTPARDTSKQKPSWSSRFGGGKRPQRLGGAGTRHRMAFLCLLR